jgi:hypothetical protein
MMMFLKIETMSKKDSRRKEIRNIMPERVVK